ncbi:MAG: GDP-mannose 4,6-dehydratase [Candidatus Omnitrophota bacterium]
MTHILLTGAAGFIGARTAENLLDKGYKVLGIDNINDYYDIRLKEYRLDKLKGRENFAFQKVDIEDLEALEDIFRNNNFAGVINLAARAGVRASLIDPFVYIRTNTLGTVNLLELCKRHDIKKFVLASTSSLYAGQPMPFREDLAVNEPISTYAASKKGAEAACYAYHYLYDMDITVVRYFTVYGEAGRPDMSLFRFIKWIAEDTPIELFGDGTQSRDFTYVGDIAEGTVKAFEAKTGYAVINLGGNDPYKLNYAIELMEKYLGKHAKRDLKPFHKADIKDTWADITKAQTILNWNPTVSLEEGIKRTVEWYLANREWAKDIPL